MRLSVVLRSVVVQGFMASRCFGLELQGNFIFCGGGFLVVPV